jgi:hypothetical protein
VTAVPHPDIGKLVSTVAGEYLVAGNARERERVASKLLQPIKASPRALYEALAALYALSEQAECPQKNSLHALAAKLWRRLPDSHSRYIHPHVARTFSQVLRFASQALSETYPNDLHGLTLPTWDTIYVARERDLPRLVADLRDQLSRQESDEALWSLIKEIEAHERYPSPLADVPFKVVPGSSYSIVSERQLRQLDAADDPGINLKIFHAAYYLTHEHLHLSCRQRCVHQPSLTALVAEEIRQVLAERIDHLPQERRETAQDLVLSRLGGGRLSVSVKGGHLRLLIDGRVVPGAELGAFFNEFLTEQLTVPIITPLAALVLGHKAIERQDVQLEMARLTEWVYPLSRTIPRRRQEEIRATVLDAIREAGFPDEETILRGYLSGEIIERLPTSDLERILEFDYDHMIDDFRYPPPPTPRPPGSQRV